MPYAVILRKACGCERCNHETVAVFGPYAECPTPEEGRAIVARFADDHGYSPDILHQACAMEGFAMVDYEGGVAAAGKLMQDLFKKGH